MLFKQAIINTGNYQFSAKAGRFTVTITETAEVIVQQNLPKILASFPAQEVAPLLNLKAEALSSSLPIEALSTGLADLIIPIPFGLLDEIKPNLTRITAFCSENNIIGLHLFELNENNKKITASCRNFAPLVGIDEESATGSACGALACYLNKHLNISEFSFEQGRSMNCRSLLNSTVFSNDSEITCITVGGSSKLIKSEVITL